MAPQNCIVVIDDESQIRKILSITLEAEDYKVIEASKGKDGIIAVANFHPQLVILDLGLPDQDGFSVLKEIRTWSNVPVIILSVKSSEDDIVKALDLGADDYITKPFNTSELHARIRANIRRNQQIENEPFLVNGKLKIDFSKRIVLKGNKELKLTNTEYLLLNLFFKNVDKVLTHNFVLKEIWGPTHAEDSQYLRVFIGQIRKKIEDDASHPKYILTESGVGYRMKLLV
ncbi:MAG: DNA-binding response regulator [Stygiobacter sp. RIFOXYC12_FULL_38_8]|nr:MAG: two component transcriptional regulator winged helix family [Ignavibacteria bacterium]OGU67988.1 MAG: DNA-binding response regulator [Stygiobacter sp. GWC2_38_9]OGU83197.1 MAG: DNA-binding response regulator [Stygiobacter sp. RIFOXYA12_FULL_38_9]OGV07660.1 MAG: DNA-binding response regulator [Stygiobacter sp. RIFOXYB2_FULL_37_11]OGV10822.1 MAG: DNA-binding response regulator [Stygiobacter sp. RIFOXYA2_FULL_38_8]OGV12663.1 MAG: DNA-binding response regulator [Stygiobacter sp. RIFOXYC2_F